MFCCLTISMFCIYFFFFFNDTATTEIYTLSLHDALPIFPFLASSKVPVKQWKIPPRPPLRQSCSRMARQSGQRSEEHTSELQSQSNLVCRLLLEKKK